MLRLGLFILLFFPIAQISLGQSAEYFEMSGTIYNMEHEPVKLAHIKAQQSFRGAISNNEGNFRIKVSKGDVLTVTAVGYKPRTIYLPVVIDNGYAQSIYLTTDTIQLKEAIIRPWPATYEKLKESVVNMNYVESTDFQIKDKFMLSLAEKAEYAALTSSGVGMTFAGPITMLYNAFGDKPKQYRQLARDKAKFEKQEQLAEKFDYALVKQVTQMQCEDSLLMFMAFCNFSEDYLIQASEYELVVQIQNKFQDFIRKED